MTTQETFKRRIRERMHSTGERYGAARRALIEEAERRRGSHRVADPVHPDDVIRTHTGHGWDEWVALIDAGPGRTAGHTAIAAWVGGHDGVSAWWAQGVTVGYERITGIRLPGQMPDGTFTVSRSRTVGIAPDELRALVDDGSAVPGLELRRLSKPGVKAPRYALAREGEELGVGMFSFDTAGVERTRLVVTHERIPSVAEAELWKDVWADWLADLDALAP